jgi:hypothetical protein
MLRVLLFGLIFAGHIGFLLWLDAITRYGTQKQDWQTRTVVEFVTRKPPILPALPRQRVSNQFRQSPEESASSAFRTNEPVKSPAAASENFTLRIVDSEGQIWIPQTAKDEFLKNGQSRQFDIQRDGLDNMDALLKRPVVLDYRSTRFDEAWQGDKPRITRVLEAAVEKTTATVKIPIPGRPGAFLQCSLMVLAAAGGCGFTANDDGYFVAHDDPDTLSPLEEQQCQAWWDLIVSAKTQAEWRRTRRLYEQECQKPAAKQ